MFPSLRNRDWKNRHIYIDRQLKNPSNSKIGNPGVRHWDLTMVPMPYQFPMLYNLSNDKAEQNGIAGKEKIIADTMIEKIGQWNMSCLELFFSGKQK